MVILFLDDNPARHETMDSRYPSAQIIHTYSIDEFREALEKHEHFDEIWLDYNLNDFQELGYFSYCAGNEADGVDACGYLMKFMDKVCEIVIHSSNGDGARAMLAFLQSRGVTKARWKMFEVDILPAL